MGQTTNYNIPYPETDNPRNIPEDMKNMAEKIEEAINGINKKTNAITVGITNDYTVQADNTDETLPLDNIIQQVGDKLSIENGGIKIGSGISAVIVSAQVYYYTGTSGVEKNAYIFKNDSRSIAFNRYMPENYEHISVPVKVETVTEGDIMYLKIRGKKGDLFKNYTSGTFLTVVAI